MPSGSAIPWSRLEEHSSTAFLVAGGLFAGAGAATVAEIATGTSAFGKLLGQTFISLAWTAGSVGLVGMYPALADRSRWLSRAGAVFAAVGAVNYAVMAAVAFAFFAGVPDGTFGEVFPLFLPGGLVGSLLAFPTVAAARLRADAGPRAVSLLLVVQTVIFLVNGPLPSEAEIVLVVILALLLVNLAVGYLLGSSERRGGHEDVEATTDPSAG